MTRNRMIATAVSTTSLAFAVMAAWLSWDASKVGLVISSVAIGISAASCALCVFWDD